MRTKQWIAGVNNKQRIRVIINGVGFYSTVEDALSSPFSTQSLAMHSILMQLVAARQKEPETTGFSSTVRVYNDKMEQVPFDIQVDLV
jgi:hypothetical protein